MNDKIRQASVDITSLGFQPQNLTSTLIESTEIELFEFFFSIDLTSNQYFTREFHKLQEEATALRWDH